MQVEMRATADLLPYARNARTHPEWQVAQIAASIAEFGFANPILVGSEGVIIAGHGRLMAAQRLGLEEVPVIALGHLSPAQQRALVIADNKIAENAGWDEDLLRSELSALQGDGFDLEVIGFSVDEIDELLAGSEGGFIDPTVPLPGDPDLVPDPPADPVTQRGQIWRLGEHRLLCGDATAVDEVSAFCADRAIDAVWTDPPYNVDYEGSAGKIQNDHMPATEFRRFLVGAFAAAFAVCRKGAPIYVAHADTEGRAFRGAFADAGFKLSGCLVWVKPSLVLGRSDYQWRHEPILYGWKPGAAHSWYGGRANTTVFDGFGEAVRVMPDGSLQIDLGDRTLVVQGSDMTLGSVEGSVLRFDKPARNGEHPTMKPVALIERMLGNSTKRGAYVLDLFGGSGSTLIACERMSRRARLVELDEKFCDVIVARWEQLTGREAVLEEDGRTFAQVRTARRAA